VRKLLAITGAAAVLLVAAGGRVEAAPFTVAGITYGAFDDADPSSPASLGPLTFTGTSFDVTTEDDGTGGEYAPSEGPAHFGFFSLGTAPYIFTEHTFTFTVHFSEPSSAAPNPSAVSATLLGRVRLNGAGGVSIFYDEPTQVSFNSGSFYFGLNDVTLSAGETNVAQRGYVEGVQALPEPASLLLFGLGSATMIGIGRGRRRLVAA
jgi:hypothetical protein